MPRIIVQADCVADRRIVLQERVVVAHFESDHASAQLVERLGWAIIDADELERAEIDRPASTRDHGRFRDRRARRSGVIADDAEVSDGYRRAS